MRQSKFFTSQNLYFTGIVILLIWVVYLIFPFFISMPNGLHFIRQTDSLSFVYGFLYHDFNLFAPSTLNLSSDGGRAACEFPIVYWISAVISSFGVSPIFALKSIHLAASITGIYFLFRTYRLLLSNVGFVLGGVAVSFSSTIWLYYLSNTLPDAAALGITLIGIYFAIFSLLNDDTNALKKALVILAFAALLKITYGIYLIALLCTIVIQKKHPLNKIIKWSVWSISPAVIWSIYSNYYNLLHHSNYFLTFWVPIWSLSALEIQIVLDYLSRFWRSNFYYQTTQHVFMALCVFFGFTFRKVQGSIFRYLLFTALGSLFYVLFFFDKFRDHDYYLMVFIPSLALFFALFLVAFEKVAIYPYLQKIIVFSLFGLAILSNKYAFKKLNERFNRKSDQYSVIHNKLNHFDSSFLMENENKIAVVGDYTMNGSLTFLEIQGITIPGSKLNLDEIKNSIEREGIKQILVLDTTLVPDVIDSMGFKKIRNIEESIWLYTK
jgi:hypothetical protein